MAVAPTSALGDTDLSSYLTQPPSSDWLEAQASTDVMDGPFNSHQYAVYIDGSDSERVLNKYGFVRGFGREWEQKATQDYLVQLVFLFRSTTGAGYVFQDLKLDAQTSKRFQGGFAALDAKTSVGLEFAYPDAARGYEVIFMKGNLVFDLTMFSRGEDLSQTIIGLARTDYDLAPDTVNVATQSSPILSRAAATAVGVGMIGLVVLITTLIFFALRSRRRLVAMPSMPGDFQLSADGTKWWDGARWRSSNTDMPPTARRSPDGMFWWDGRSWRNVPGGPG